MKAIGEIAVHARQAAGSQTARAAMGYLVANSLNAGLPLILLPFLTHYLSPSDYGNVAMFQALNAIFSTVTIFGLRVPLLRMLSVSKTGRANYMTSVLCLAALTMLLAVFAAMLFDGYIRRTTHLSTLWIGLAIVSAGAGTIFQLFLTVYQADGKARSYGIWLNSSSFVNLLLSVALVAWFGLGWIGRALGIVLSICGAAGASLISLWRQNLVGVPVREDVQDAFSLASASVVYGISTVFVTYADRFYLGSYYSNHVVGIYTIAAQASMILILFGQSLNLAIAPWAYRQLAALRTFSQLRRLGWIAFSISVFVVLISFGFFILLKIALPYLVSSKYQGASTYLPWLLGASCFNALYFVFSPPIFFYKRIGILSGVGVAILVTSVLLLYVFQSSFGPIGVAIAMFGSRFLLFATAFCLGVYFAISRVRQLETAEIDSGSEGMAIAESAPFRPEVE